MHWLTVYLGEYELLQIFCLLSQAGFVISNDIIRQASTAKTWGSLACNLMTALFSREEMANSCLTQKQAAKTGKIALPAEKVQAITDQVKKVFPSSETGAIRIKLSTKLRDERNAFSNN
ncbi:hypothetical protein HOLleu_01241 [Holothuria leucospilota]|uniref:BEN domain-containing protein n=1 Tax=Holothuria leucospilota TaxID=206669 RepID=A0A9Q1CQR5_HOLLE|nr:hypothetical protein HOLleu_01241 [Holothuria leucospilota]